MTEEIKPRKPGSGGVRPGAGAKKIINGKDVKVKLTPEQVKFIKGKYGSPRKALLTLIPE